MPTGLLLIPFRETCGSEWVYVVVLWGTGRTFWFSAAAHYGSERNILVTILKSGSNQVDITNSEF